MRETSNTGSECTSDIGIDQSHFSSLIEVLVMHILDQVQGIYIYAYQPVHHYLVLTDHFIIIKVFRSNWCVLWTNLLFGLHITSTVHSVQ